MKPNIGLSDEKLKAITKILTSVLADGVMIYTKNAADRGRKKNVAGWQS